MRAAVLVLVLAACGSKTAGTQPVDDHPCDPKNSRTPVPVPVGSPQATCGNGVLEESVTSCEEVCLGGCSKPVECNVVCLRPKEICDGAANATSCAEQGYIGGEVRCTPECNLDIDACEACAPGPGVRCGKVAIDGDETYVIATSSGGAAVFARDVETGKLQGASVTAALKTRTFAGLPRTSVAATALDGALGFVDAKRRFGTIDVRGRMRVLGPIGEGEQVMIARDTFNRGGAAVIAGDYQHRTLAVFGSAPAGEPRHFFLGNLRIVVVPGSHELARGAATNDGDLVVIVFGTERFAYRRTGFELEQLPTVPAGIDLAFTYPRYIDKIGTRTTTRSTNATLDGLPAGLSRAALAGASTATAFGGVLFGRGAGARTELYWAEAADPLAPSNP